ncbi:glutathione S-transferase family protein [Thalassomonas sp. RHCl1]|uniref:glutathione S-transferase family protein n=1 Tax=Thalassomonas sp. RHCl1 TaxID=2995320 RepID=UPI00248CD55F|nr:glutathione S-transferase family protein [Thalassomonas sp. RHCl1]
MNTDLTLYYNPLTVNSIKVQLLCHALEIEVNYQHIALPQGEHLTRRFLEINPDGKVPVLIDGNQVLTESNAILQYLANKHQSSLWPKEVLHQARVLKWLLWQVSDWQKAVGPFAHRRVILPHWGFTAHEQLTPQALADFDKAMARLELALTGKQTLVADSFTLADIAIGSNLILAEEAQIPLESYPQVRHWLEQLAAHSWWQKTRQTLTEILDTKHAYA